jgi:hypothetical protein
MAKKATLTYGRLYQKLREFGFEEYGIEWDGGKRGVAFEHPKFAGSRILLPEHAPDDEVESFDMNYVLMTLRARGIVPETNPLLS